MKPHTMNQERLDEIYKIIGIASIQGLHYKERLKKQQQVFDFIAHLEKALNKLSKKRELVLVDCACGKSYLSFIANYYFTEIQGRNIKFYGIDYNSHVIARSKEAAKKLGYTNMNFICSDIFKVPFSTRPDIVYSLHACDTATDMTIAKGLIEQAQFIMTVSCCQHTVRNTLKAKHMGPITRHGVYKERLTDMVADSMRALLMESQGYKTSLFEYVPASETPKNIMIRATRVGAVSPQRKQICTDEYETLQDIFMTEPALRKFLRHDNLNDKPEFRTDIMQSNKAL